MALPADYLHYHKYDNKLPRALTIPINTWITSKLIYVVVSTSQNDNITPLTVRNGDWSRGWVISSAWLSHLAICATLPSQSHAKLSNIYRSSGYQLFGIELGSKNLYPNNPTSLGTLQIIANISHWSIFNYWSQTWRLDLNQVVLLIRPTNSSNVMATTEWF